MTIEQLYNIIAAHSGHLCRKIIMMGNPVDRVEATMPDHYTLVFMDGSLSGIYPQANELWYIEIRTPQGLPHTEANLTPKGSARAEIDPRTAPDLVRAYHDHDQEGAWSL